MKKIILIGLWLIFSLNLIAQYRFKITGKIERLSKSSRVIIQGSDEFIAPIRDDGSFEITGEVTEPGFALIKTDSTGADAIWLEAGDYQLVCREITLKNINKYLFRIPQFSGPMDASIYHGFVQPRYSIRGTTPDDSKLLRKNIALRYIDSIFKVAPQSNVIPHLVSISQSDIGDEAAAFYVSLFSPDQKNDSTTKRLEDYFKRKTKIEKEKLFENFTMKKSNGKSFTLSSVINKKIILIDFWSSDCIPCRYKHKKLVELYKKYSAIGLEIISVSLDDDKKTWLKAIQKDAMTWINVSDLKGWQNQLAESYFVKSIPYGLWLDGDKKIIGPELSDTAIEAYLK
ncbi:MAG: TlpA family protein disulfide reductase [Chitinophagaceae bacterium]